MLRGLRHFDICHNAAGHLHQFVRREKEDGVWMPSRCPDFCVGEEIGIDEGTKGSLVTKGRNAADDKAGLGAYKICVGAGDFFADQRLHFRFINSIAA